MQVYGVHTGEGSQYEGVRVANMEWNSETNRYEFTPANDVDGPLITWTPGKPEGTDQLSHTGTAAPTIDQTTILVNPIPENQGESTTPPFPVPDEKDFNDYILVFPADSGVQPIYVYLKDSPRSQPGTATGKGEILSGTERCASAGLGASIPAQVADKLRGKYFRNFDHFREHVSRTPAPLKAISTICLLTPGFLAFHTPVSTDFRGESDIHFIFIKYRICHIVFLQCSLYCSDFFSIVWILKF
ncbi:colicin/pyocin immunity family protein [Yersinia pseudotuberculosis]|nr:colicin/pyocin immunity family protein [Yersinia pseudotuberculosis]